MKKFYTADRETGTHIEAFKTYEEAKKAIEAYEAQDKADDTYEENFYDIVDEEHCTIERDLQGAIDKVYDYVTLTRTENANPQEFDDNASVVISNYIDCAYNYLNEEEKKEVEEAVLDLYKDFIAEKEGYQVLLETFERKTDAYNSTIIEERFSTEAEAMEYYNKLDLAHEFAYDLTASEKKTYYVEKSVCKIIYDSEGNEDGYDCIERESSKDFEF